MNYTELKNKIRNDDSLYHEGKIMVLGYIDYCEQNNISIEKVIDVIRRSFWNMPTKL